MQRSLIAMVKIGMAKNKMAVESGRWYKRKMEYQAKMLDLRGPKSF